MYDIREKDRVFKYFEKYLESFLFLELKEEFWDKIGIEQKDRVSVPILPHDLKTFEDGHITIGNFAENMIFVIGANPNFKFVTNYINIFKKIFEENIVEFIIGKGHNCAIEKDMEKACIYFRTALILNENSMDAMFGYARACREIYIEADDNDMIGDFKAESIELFEQLSIDYPNFDGSYYFLGYSYLNMGLYVKAELAWSKYMQISKSQEGILEVASRLKEIKEPVEIEKACNLVISGKYHDGYVELIKFLNSDYNTWWPLHFYIAIASEELGNLDMAEERFKNVIKLQPAMVDAMDGLIRIYEKTNRFDLVEKYEQKKSIIIKNFSEIGVDK